MVMVLCLVVVLCNSDGGKREVWWWCRCGGWVSCLGAVMYYDGVQCGVCSSDGGGAMASGGIVMRW